MKVSGILCCRYVGLWRHDPQRVLPGGFRCRRCDTPGATQGELLGVDDQLDAWKLSDSTRQQLASQPVAWPEVWPSKVVRAFTREAV